MNPIRVLVLVSSLALAPLAAQEPPPGTGAAPAAAPDLDAALRRALATADYTANADADKAVLAAGTEGRARLRTLRQRLAPIAKALPQPDPAVKPMAAGTALDEATQAQLADLVADDDAKAEAAAGALLARVAEAPEQVRAVVRRGEALFANHILGVFRRHAATGAIFAGQYAELRDLGPDAVDLLAAWVVRPPTTAPGLRTQCVRALRDVVEGEPGEKVAKALEQIAASAAEDRDVQREARCALAQFGNRTFIEPQIEKLTQQLEGDDAAVKGEALRQLADIHYQLRDYKNAVEAYQAHIALIEAGKVGSASVQMPTLYYNTCCSMALAGMTDEAFAMLEKAIATGRKSGQPLRRSLLEVDRDIDSLRKDPRFATVMAAFDAPKKDPAPGK